MRRVEFAWDDRKAQSNLAKHRINFVDARYVFEDPDAVYQQDRVVSGEERWQVIGWSRDYALLNVAYVSWDEGDGSEVYRIISARRATRAERQTYEEAS